MWYLLRHPQTLLNKEQKYHGWGFMAYTKHGHQQVNTIVNYCQKLKISQIISSDLWRCKSLARKISASKDNNLTCTKLLRELNFGVWHGKTYQEIHEAYHNEVDKWSKDPWVNAPINGETLNQLKARCLDFLHKHKSEDLIIVTHGGVIAVFRSLIKNIEYWKLLPHHNECTIINWEKKTMKIDIIEQ